MEKTQNRMLVVVDGSYFLYYTIFGAVAEFQKKCTSEAAQWIKPAEEVDQNNVPDLLACEKFKEILKKFVMKRCETIDWQLKSNFPDELDAADSIDIVFALDDYVKNSFRKAMYPEYKAQRRIAKKSFDMFKIHQYVLNVIFKDLDVENKYGYHFIKVPGAEGDDVIATIFRKLGNEYWFNVLFASDHDFVQLENVHQLNLFGQPVECKIGDVNVTRQEYLLGKILLGDGSDNIPKVFPRIGNKKVLPLIKDKKLLKEKLLESEDAASKFLLNKQLISFDYIPEELSAKIEEAARLALYKDLPLNSATDLRAFMMM